MYIAHKEGEKIHQNDNINKHKNQTKHRRARNCINRCTSPVRMDQIHPQDFHPSMHCIRTHVAYAFCPNSNPLLPYTSGNQDAPRKGWQRFSLWTRTSRIDACAST